MKDLLGLFFVLMLCCTHFQMKAQPENIRINNEPGIEELLSKHLYYNEVTKTVPGFRLQIFSGSGNFSKSNAVTERTRFLGRYPHVKAYIVFNTPYYIVRVGNFRSRLEAESFRQQIIDVYPEAYIVRDDIDLPGSE